MSRIALVIVLPVLAVLALVLAVLSLRSVDAVPGQEPAPRRKARRAPGPLAMSRSLARPTVAPAPAVAAAR